MLPSVVSREIREGIRSFLTSSFPPSTPLFEGALERLLERPGAVFKGPYHSLRLPFKSAASDQVPLEMVNFPYRPHLHQAMALDRLSGPIPLSTIVGTGTGSGKTECFLYPVLDHCAKHAAEKGIKAIVLYPMNALATDQAKRFASAVNKDPALKGKTRVGMYVGGEGDESKVMTPDWVITDRETMRKNPPDVLLTNYKMLDYLLIRPEDLDLWQENHAETLKFLVVDELHTFDGAQATDLACLIRRLKSRLNTPEAHLCCVGTSATIGSEQDGDKLRDYASILFDEPFPDQTAIIQEHLLPESEFLQGYYIRRHSVPTKDDIEELTPDQFCTKEDYLRKQYKLWFGKEAPEQIDDNWRVSLGEQLREHIILRNLLVFLNNQERKQVEELHLLQQLALEQPDFQDPHLAAHTFDSLSSLCGWALYQHPETGARFPLLRTHVHFWFRELSRMVGTIRAAPKEKDESETEGEGQEDDSSEIGEEEKEDNSPELLFSKDLPEEELGRVLPIIHCRECGSMGWGALQKQGDNRLLGDLDTFYKCFFGYDPKLALIYHAFEGYKRDPDTFLESLCGHCLNRGGAKAKSCKTCGQDDRLLVVEIVQRNKKQLDRLKAERSCPHCESQTGLTILGSRSASLSSVALGQLFATRYNSDKQALAFSDNVQDASHRANFFSARTYRTTLRTAICKSLQAAPDEISLSDFGDRFIEQWTKDMSGEDFVGTFLAPNMEWLSDYQALQKKGSLPHSSKLPKELAKRLRFELIFEFGYQSRIGRTLEKTGTAIAYLPPVLVEEACQVFGKNLREKAGGWGSVTDEQLRYFLQGLLHRLRTIGGVYHPQLETYFEEGANPYTLNRLSWAPSFGSNSRRPVAFALGSGAGNLETAASNTRRPWLQKWAEQCLSPIGALDAEGSTIVVEEALAALCEVRALTEKLTRKEARFWTIPHEQLILSRDVAQMACSSCGHPLSLEASKEQPLWLQSPCLRSSCSGHYEPKPEEASYFGELYQTGDVSRLHAEEHTGLISRKEREGIEKRFMATADRHAADPNLLSCTPTLEMGIDIGDLSSVLLCSVPPATANYLQRVGRAGRRDGNALSLTVASSQEHDLAFFREPHEMMDGEVRVPAVFLDAPAVLERQFLAFCFDEWVATSQPRPEVPHKISAALKNVLEPTSPPSGFPYDLLTFVSSQVEDLLLRFITLFEEQLSSDSRQLLNNHARGKGSEEGSLAWKVVARLRDLGIERRELQKKRNAIRQQLKKREETPAKDEVVLQEIRELQQTLKGISGIVTSIGTTQTFNFFTDEGLLPNYAFPEEGVTLRSIILRKKEKKDGEGGGAFESQSFEYQRPASSAIRELAPGSTFYAQHRKLIVDQVNLQLSEPELWNFCDQCSYSERIDTGSPLRQTCPVCMSAQWSDRSMQRKMIPMKQVVTTEIDSSSRSHDESDERSPEFFDHTMSVAIPDSEIEKAFEVADTNIPFGFEFIRLAKIRSINLGQSLQGGEAYQLCGEERSASGFKLCGQCGKVQGARKHEKEFRHDISCSRRNKENTEPLEAFFLYRELSSEALRILIPSVGAKNEVELSSFVSALKIGLSEHFGNIEHLNSCFETRPIQGSSLKRTYLVVYDKVPGGTGYLKELAQNETRLLEVLRKALDFLRSCACRPEVDKDGCHRCILRERRSQSKNPPSSATAVQLLEQILDHQATLKPIKSLSAIDINPLLESELEQAFLQALQTTKETQFRTELLNGKEGYLFTIAGQTWEIEPQVTIEQSATVPLQTRPDFILRPQRRSRSLPVALYLDGYAFHADEDRGHNRIAKDIAQREGLRRSKDWNVWSLTWQDLAPSEEAQKCIGGNQGQLAQRRSLLEELQLSEPLRQELKQELSNWKLFFTYLQNSERTEWSKAAYAYALSLSTIIPCSFERLQGTLKGLLSDFKQPPSTPLNDGTAAEAFGFQDSFHEGRWNVLLFSPLAALKQRDAKELHLLLHFDDDRNLAKTQLQPDWRGLLLIQNLLQFLPQAFLITSRGISNGYESPIEENWQLSPPEAAPQTIKEEHSIEDWALVSPTLVPFLKILANSDLPSPSIGYELFNSQGTNIGEAELAWEEQKVVLLLEDQMESQRFFENHSWTCLLWNNDPSSTIETLTSLLS